MTNSPTHPSDDHEDIHKAVRAFKSAPVPSDGRMFLDKPPEDLRAAVTYVIRAVKKHYTEPGMAIPSMNDNMAINDILALCEAAALAALPEKIEVSENLADSTVAFVKGQNHAIATAQANIHSVFGGTQ